MFLLLYGANTHETCRLHLIKFRTLTFRGSLQPVHKICILKWCVIFCAMDVYFCLFKNKRVQDAQIKAALDSIIFYYILVAELFCIINVFAFPYCQCLTTSCFAPSNTNINQRNLTLTEQCCLNMLYSYLNCLRIIQGKY